jgi:hypothetical protein
VTKKIQFRLLAVLILLLPFSGCGIDEFIYLEPATWLWTPSSAGDVNYYKFRTSDQENSNIADEYFRGFEIFYRIYNSVTVMSQDTSDITTYNTNNPTGIALYLQTTKKYVRLSYDLSADELNPDLKTQPLIEGTSTDRDVKIRLIDYGTAEPASIFAAAVNLGKPVRSNGQAYPDYLFLYDEIDSSDTDVSHSSSGESDRWFVQAYVLAYGYNQFFSPLYSEALSLGIITITSTD